MFNIILQLHNCKNFKINISDRSRFLGLLQKHRLKCNVPDCKCHTYTRILNESNYKNIDKHVSIVDNQIKMRAKNKKINIDGYNDQNTNIENSVSTLYYKFLIIACE